MRTIVLMLALSSCTWAYSQPAFHAWDAWEIDNFLTHSSTWDTQGLSYTGRYLYDTVIQGQNYQAFVYGKYSLPGGTGTFLPWGTQYFTRDGDKVYTIYPSHVDTAYKVLFFDYAGTAGDTIPLSEVEFAFYIQQVDTQFIYGKNRKVYTGYLAQYIPGALAYMVDFGSPKCDTCSIMLVEGMGSNYAIFEFYDRLWDFHFGPDGSGATQLCKLKAYDSLFTLIYDYANCDFTSGIVKGETDGFFMLNHRKVPLAQVPGNILYQVYATDGRLLEEAIHFIPHSGYELDIPLPPGLTVVQVQGSGPMPFTMKHFTPE